MSFPVNSLPEEFQQEHGSIDLGAEDEQGNARDDHLDEDLNLDRAGHRVWLCKVPRFLLDRWNRESTQPGAILGRVRVYDEKDDKGNPKIAVLLNEAPSEPRPDSQPDVKGKGKLSASSHRDEPAGDGVPTEYRLTMQNTASKNMFVFGERIEDDEETGEEGARKKRRVTSVLGTVHHECSLTPSLASRDAAASYARILRERQRKAAEPKRTLKRLDVDQATANRLASGMGMGGVKARVSTFMNTGPTSTRASAASSSSAPRFTRMPHNELLDLLIHQFSLAPYWSLKSLNEHVQQPQTYLKQTLNDIAVLVRNGPYAGMWALKPEFKTGMPDRSATQGATSSQTGPRSGSGAGGGDVKLQPGGGRGEVKPDPGVARTGALDGGQKQVKKEEGDDEGVDDDDDGDDEGDDDEGMEIVS
ncbi:hypothetical protein JCM10212_000890 [Sporobolomyces blumeae]